MLTHRVRAVLLVGVVSAASAWPSSAGAQIPPDPLPTACDAPYLPVWRGIVDSPFPDDIEEPPYGGTDLRYQRDDIFDSDGNGQQDTIDDPSGGPGGLVVHRQSGDLEFAADVDGNEGSWGDYDGDGRSDIFVEITSPGRQVYLVPGSTPDGPVDLATSGILMPEDWLVSLAVGDHDGDGIEDVVAFLDEGSGGGRARTVYSGAALAAPGPGGTFAGPPLQMLPGTWATTLVLGGQLTFVVAVDGSSPGRFQVLTDPVIEVTKGDDLEQPPDEAIFGGAVTAYADGAATWLVATLVTVDGDQAWAWRLDDLCAGMAPAVAPPPPPATAPPAEPVDAEAAFTG